MSTQVPVSAAKPEQRTAVYLAIRDRLLATPGVRQVAAVSRLPMMGSDLTSNIFAEGQDLTKGPPRRLNCAAPRQTTSRRWAFLCWQAAV